MAGRPDPSGIVGYQLTIKNPQHSVIRGTTRTKYTQTGARIGQTQRYSLVAIDRAGNISSPTTLQYTPGSLNGIRLRKPTATGKANVKVPHNGKVSFTASKAQSLIVRIGSHKIAAAKGQTITFVVPQQDRISANILVQATTNGIKKQATFSIVQGKFQL